MLVSKKVSVTNSKKFILKKSRGIGLKNFGLGNGLKDLQLTARRYIVFNLFSSETISYNNSYQLLRRYELQIFGSSHGKETPTNVISKFDWKRYFWIIITCLAYGLQQEQPCYVGNCLYFIIGLEQLSAETAFEYLIM